MKNFFLPLAKYLVCLELKLKLAYTPIHCH